MILVGLGGNLPHPRFGPPSETLAQALVLLGKRGVRVVRRSRWYSSPPDPVRDQPWYTNGVALVETAATPAALLQTLLEVEQALGRQRSGQPRNAPRTIDLDLLAYDDLVQSARPAEGVLSARPTGGLDLPHPRLHARAFVLQPLAEVAPGWVHPDLRRTVEELIVALPPGSQALPIGGSDTILWSDG